MEPLEQREQIFIQYKKWLYYLGNPRPIFLCLCVGCVISSIRSTHLSPRPSFHRLSKNQRPPSTRAIIATARSPKRSRSCARVSKTKDDRKNYTRICPIQKG